MAVTIEAGALARALKSAAGVVASANTIPILANVRLIADGGTLDLVTSDLDTEYRQILPLGQAGELSTTVDARRLAAVIGAVDSKSQVSLAMEEARLAVKAGRSRWRFPTLPAADFPLMPFTVEGTALELSGKVLAGALARTAWSASTEAHRYYLNGVLLGEDAGKLRAVATNGHTLVAVDTDVAWPVGWPEVIVASKTVRLIDALAADRDALTIAWNAGKLRIDAGDVTVTAKLIDGTFPDYRRVIPPESTATLVDAGQLAGAVRRCTMISSEKTRSIRIVRGDGTVTVSTVDPASGTAEEEVPAEGESRVETGVNAQYLAQMLTAIGGDTVEIHQQDAGCAMLLRRVVRDGALGVVMPMRV